MLFSRVWAMPNSNTFDIQPINQFVRKYKERFSISIDPFARDNSIGATYSNDLNLKTSSDYHMDAIDFLTMLVNKNIYADLIIFDPPYSPRQISECYASAGLTCGMKDTQNARLCKECRDLFKKLSRPGTICLSFGWNSTGMGKNLWDILEIMLVCHGGGHNDTICVAQKFIDNQIRLFN